jgi:two-component system, OmpR family, sensor histidine kinase BaeS
MSDEVDRRPLAVVVHELKSPVAALAAISASLRGGRSDGRRELARLAIAACHGIARTMADANVASVQLVRVDVGEIVSDAVAAARLEGADARAEIDSDLALVDGDPERLRQALDNLVRNAMTHADDSSIVVRARMDRSRVIVSVSDDGPGIAPSDQERVFEPGLRLERSRQGSGLGLAVARTIAVAHGGVLTVESTPGEGATFSIGLPAVH